MILATPQHIPVRLIAYDWQTRWATVARQDNGHIRAVPFDCLHETMRGELGAAVARALAAQARLDGCRCRSHRAGRARLTTPAQTS